MTTTTTESGSARSVGTSARRQGSGDFARGVNVGPGERAASALAGAVLALYGVTRSSARGALLALAGGALVHRGVTGHCRGYAALGIDRSPTRPGAFTGNLGVKVDKAVLVRAAPERLFAFWHAEIINERPNELIAWQTVNDARMAHAGSVHFEPTADPQATIVRVSLQYAPPGGRVGHAVASFLGRDAGDRIEADLDNFKCAVEEGRAA